ncbi:MAG: exodeoxyribonuclease VII small subunit [Chloroflexi bacterium]|nr:exodeoxyribonuclease VII small subunit [Chloroflexota bacterium]
MAEEPQRPKGGKLTFEEALTRLDKTVQALEAGGLTLEEATRLYEEGMRLARLCNELLSHAELKVKRLQTSFGEQMRFLEEEHT